jgi:predicted O-methyltransferase YrrM
MDPRLRSAAEAARGFMPPDEGDALYESTRSVRTPGALLEIGTYCGKSAIYLGAAARELDRVLFTLDHHRGSEENQAGWEHHDPDLVDPETGRMDTLSTFRRTIHDAHLEETVVAIVGHSEAVARAWQTPLAFLFIDGGHGSEPAHRDYDSWVPHIELGGVLAIHDVFPDPADGGRPPYELYCRALESGEFEDVRTVGSLRILRRADGRR